MNSLELQFCLHQMKTLLQVFIYSALLLVLPFDDVSKFPAFLLT